MREIDVAPEVRIAFTPEAAYRSLVAADERISAWRAVYRPAIVAIVIGTAVPIMAVQRVSLELLAISTLSFTVLVAIQAVVGLAVIAPFQRYPLSRSRAIDLWFAGHLPYSLWLLMMAALIASMPAAGLDLLIASAVVPAAWTAVIVAAFCRHVLGTTGATARWLAFAHFVVIWLIGFQLVAWSAGGWFQITRSISAFFT